MQTCIILKYLILLETKKFQRSLLEQQTNKIHVHYIYTIIFVIRNTKLKLLKNLLLELLVLSYL